MQWECLRPNVATTWSNVAPMLPQCCPIVAPRWSNVAQCGTNVTPMLPLWDPKVATKRWEYPFCWASAEKFPKWSKNTKNWNHQCSGNVCAPMWPQRGPMLPQCCPIVAPFLPQCCPNAGPLLLQCGPLLPTTSPIWPQSCQNWTLP